MRVKMKRLMSRYLLGYLLAVCPMAVYALGLGDIELHSALNEPLSAEIELVSASAEELRTLTAALADRDTFARYGVEPSKQVSALQFAIARDNAGRNVLRVTSTEAISDPFLTFLVEVSWPRGRLVREYTLLLDPPVYLPGGEKSTMPVAAPRAQSQEPARNTQRQGSAPETTEASSPAPSFSAPARSTPAPGGDSSYTVRRNDTLYRIASDFSPSSSPRDINRTMLALFQSNPEAFGGNMNDLKAGAVLRVPAPADVQRIGSAEAMDEIRRQYSQWRSQRGAAPEASASEAARLKLVTPTERGEGAAATSPEAASQANALNERVSGLEQQLAEAKRMLELKDAELARLQQRLGEPAPAEPPQSVESSAAEAPASAEPEAAPPVAQEPTPEPAGETETAPVATEAAQDQPGILDSLIQYWYLPVAVLLLLGGLIFAYLRRRQEPDFETLGRLAESQEPQVREEAPATARLRPIKRDENILVEESGEHEQPHVAAALPEQAKAARKPVEAPSIEAEDFAAAVPSNKTADDTLSSETAINLDQGDPLAEADFHMAYGLYDQAADLVRIASQREPGRRDLKLKLLEIFFVWGNKEAFLQTARELRGSNQQAPAGEWDKIVIMGKQIAPEDPVFAGAGAASSSADIDLNLEGGENRLDMDVMAGFDDSAEQARGSSGFQAGGDQTNEMPDLKSSSGIDFVFDEPRADAVASTRETPTIEAEAYEARNEPPTVESPVLGDRTTSTIKEKIEASQFHKANRAADQTAELAIDDLGLDVDALSGGQGETLDTLEQTDHPRDMLESTDQAIGELEATDHPADDATVLASLDSLERPTREIDPDRTVMSPPPDGSHAAGTWVTDDQATTVAPGFGGVDTTTSAAIPNAEADATAELRRDVSADMDLDLDGLEAALATPESGQPQRGGSDEDRFSNDVFSSSTDYTATDTALDLDVSEVRHSRDAEQTRTERMAVEDMDLPELEPVTMSEVGTKLDLARAYMDMGDPEGARNILDEVLQEGSPNQKQEAQRLIESLPG